MHLLGRQEQEQAQGQGQELEQDKIVLLATVHNSIFSYWNMQSSTLLFSWVMLIALFFSLVKYSLVTWDTFQ